MIATIANIARIVVAKGVNAPVVREVTVDTCAPALVDAFVDPSHVVVPMTGANGHSCEGPCSMPLMDAKLNTAKLLQMTMSAMMSVRFNILPA